MLQSSVSLNFKARRLSPFVWQTKSFLSNWGSALFWKVLRVLHQRCQCLFPFLCKPPYPSLYESLYKKNIATVPVSVQVLLCWITDWGRWPMALWGSTGFWALSWEVLFHSLLLGCGKVSEGDPGEGILCAAWTREVAPGRVDLCFYQLDISFLFW